MVCEHFRRGSKVQKLIFTCAVKRDDLRYLGIAFCYCACLIENNRVRLVCVFDESARAEKYSVFGSRARRNHECSRCRKTESAGAGNRQYIAAG